MLAYGMPVSVSSDRGSTMKTLLAAIGLVVLLAAPDPVNAQENREDLESLLGPEEPSGTRKEGRSKPSQQPTEREPAAAPAPEAETPSGNEQSDVVPVATDEEAEPRAKPS